MSATYFNIRYSNRITQPITDPTTALIDSAFTPLITPNPSPALQQSIISGANKAGRSVRKGSTAVI
jgi:hypothetical protein